MSGRGTGPGAGGGASAAGTRREDDTIARGTRSRIPVGERRPLIGRRGVVLCGMPLAQNIARVVILAVSLLACKGEKLALDSSDSRPPPPPPTPTISIVGGALDPLYATDPAGVPLDVTAANGDTVRVTVADATGTVIRTLNDGSMMVDVARWDGHDDVGTMAPVGTYTVEAELLDITGATLAAATAPFYIVRVGVLSGTLGGDRIPLVWHEQGGVAGAYVVEDATTQTFAIATIDDGTTATPLPSLWDDLDSPPASADGVVMPAGYAYDALPTLSLAVAGDFGDAAVQLTLVGWDEPQTVSSGDTATFTRKPALAVGPSVVEETVSLSWTVDLGDGSTPVVVGTESLPLRFYATLGPPGFDQEGPQYSPWVAAIDPALRAIAGVAPTDADVTSALTTWVYSDLGIAYDTTYGASYYTTYGGRGYDNSVFDFTSFLARSNGTTVNCSDCASILEAYADMVGCDLQYTILLKNFQLNFIKAIGGTDYTHCPFGPSGCGFSYHAVTTPDAAVTIYDATLDLDGDDDPSAGPFTDLPVHGVDGTEYLQRLVASHDEPGVTYNFAQKESLR